MNHAQYLKQLTMYMTDRINKSKSVPTVQPTQKFKRNEVVVFNGILDDAYHYGCICEEGRYGIIVSIPLFNENTESWEYFVSYNNRLLSFRMLESEISKIELYANDNPVEYPITIQHEPSDDFINLLTIPRDLAEVIADTNNGPSKLKDGILNKDSGQDDSNNKYFTNL